MTNKSEEEAMKMWKRKVQRRYTKAQRRAKCGGEELTERWRQCINNKKLLNQ